MKYYFTRLIWSKNYKIVFLMIMAFMVVDIFFLNIEMPVWYEPNQSTFLAGNSEGHYMQMVVLWLLPVYLLLSTSSWHSIDERTKYSTLLMVRSSKINHIVKYIVTVFFSNFLLFFINLLLNFLLVYIINAKGTQNPWSEDLGMKDIALQLNHPLITNITFIFLASLFFALFGVFIFCLSFIFTKMTYLFFVSMAIWTLLITGEFSVLLTVQPFAEYPIAFIVKIYLIFTVLLIAISSLLCIYKVKKDDM